MQGIVRHSSDFFGFLEDVPGRSFSKLAFYWSISATTKLTETEAGPPRTKAKWPVAAVRGALRLPSCRTLILPAARARGTTYNTTRLQWDIVQARARSGLTSVQLTSQRLRQCTGATHAALHIYNRFKLEYEKHTRY